MKRAISLILVLLLCLPLCACGEGKSNETELTVENYQAYIKLNVDAGGRTYKTNQDRVILRHPEGTDLITDNYTNDVVLWLSAENVAPNFNFNGVKLKVRVFGNVHAHNPMNDYVRDDEYFDVNVDVQLNVGGTTNETVVTPIPMSGGKVIEGGIKHNVEYEVIEITGTVSPI